MLADGKNKMIRRSERNYAKRDAARRLDLLEDAFVIKARHARVLTSYTMPQNVRKAYSSSVMPLAEMIRRSPRMGNSAHNTTRRQLSAQRAQSSLPDVGKRSPSVTFDTHTCSPGDGTAISPDSRAAMPARGFHHLHAL